MNPHAIGRENFAAATHNAMSSASLALSTGGVAFRVPKGAQIADLLKVDFTGPGHVRGLLVLEDGALLCSRHPEKPVTFKCTHCTEVMCNACVHVMKRQGGQPLYLCRVCSHQCERIEIVEEKKKKGFFGFLAETVKVKLNNLAERRLFLCVVPKALCFGVGLHKLKLL